MHGLVFQVGIVRCNMDEETRLFILSLRVVLSIATGNVRKRSIVEQLSASLAKPYAALLCDSANAFEMPINSIELSGHIKKQALKFFRACFLL